MLDLKPSFYPKKKSVIASLEKQFYPACATILLKVLLENLSKKKILLEKRRDFRTV